MRKYLAEFTGTFAIVIFGTGVVVLGEERWSTVNQFWIALMFGVAVTAMIYSFGKISGAHFNPAVSVAFLIAKKFPARWLAPYMLSQFAGALAASLLLQFLFPENEYLGSTNPAGTEIQSLFLEFLLTFLLMLIIMVVAHGYKEAGKYAAIVIGMVVFLEAYFAGPLSGASMNPARSFGPAVASGHLEHLWIYFAGPVMGAVSGVGVWQLIKRSNS